MAPLPTPIGNGAGTHRNVLFYLTIRVYIISIRFSSLKISSLYFLIYNQYLHLKDVITDSVYLQNILSSGVLTG